MLEQLSQVLVTIANGVLAAIGAVMTLRTFLVLATIASLIWLALVEVEELDRRAYKPKIQRH